MSREQFTHGVKIIADEARKNDLVLGSRAIDAFRGIARLSFEKTVELGGRQQLRTPTFEFSREFIEDLPATREHRAALTDFLRSLSLRLAQPRPQQFLTLSGVPMDLEIHWPFRQVQTSDESFIHVLARVGSPWSSEANFTVALSGIDQSAMGIYSLSPPTIERFVINAIRFAVDDKNVKFYPIGRHPAELQPVHVVPSTEKEIPADIRVKEYLKRKVYWLGFREGDDRTQVPIVDPYDATYLVQPPPRVKQIARVASATKEIKLDSTGDFASATDLLLTQADTFENELAAMITSEPEFSSTSNDDRKGRPGKTEPTVFISYSTEDASFARFLFKALGDRSIKVWLDENEIRVGDSLTTRIGEALHSNDFMIIVLSPASGRSEWVKKELAEAMTKEIKQKRVVVLPVIYRRCEIPAFLTDKKYADFTTDSDSALRVLVRSIERHHVSNVS
jgi:hypothetical protein